MPLPSILSFLPDEESVTLFGDLQKTFEPANSSAECFSSATKREPARVPPPTAYIFATFVEGRIGELTEIAREIDEEYTQ